MLIPHEGKQIFSLQLNWLLIGFFVSILAGVTVLSISALYNKYYYAQESKDLAKHYGGKLALAIALDKLVKKNTESYSYLRNQLLAIAVAFDNQKEEAWHLRSLADKEEAEAWVSLLLAKMRKNFVAQLGPRGKFMPPIAHLKLLRSYAQSQLPLLSSVWRFYSRVFQVQSRIPLGRPFKSFVNLRDTSGYGPRLNPISKNGYEFHSGYDTAGPPGSPIYAVAAGRVHKHHSRLDGYGRSVILKHDFGFYSAYAHLGKALVQPGMEVTKGQRIGLMGASGRATGVHLHYEIRVGLQFRVDPQPYICALDFYTKACQAYHQQIH